MNREPDRWVTVIDIESGKPVPNLPLIYMKVKKPYWIVGQALISRKYITDKNGRAHVPSGVHLQTLGDTHVRVIDRESGKSGTATDIIYVKTRENHKEGTNNRTFE